MSRAVFPLMLDMIVPCRFWFLSGRVPPVSHCDEIYLLGTRSIGVEEVAFRSLVKIVTATLATYEAVFPQLVIMLFAGD